MGVGECRMGMPGLCVSGQVRWVCQEGVLAGISCEHFKWVCHIVC